MKIKTKLLMLLAAVIFVMTLTTVIMYTKTSSVTAELADIEAVKSVDYLVKMIDFYFDGLEDMIGNARPGIQALFHEDGTVDKEQALNQLAELFEFNKSKNIKDVCLGLESD